MAIRDIGLGLVIQPELNVGLDVWIWWSSLSRIMIGLRRHDLPERVPGGTLMGFLCHVNGFLTATGNNMHHVRMKRYAKPRRFLSQI